MRKFFWLFLVFLVCIPVAYYFIKPKPKPLPIINPVDVVENTVDPELLRMGQGHVIGSFQFLNQKGQKVSDTDFSNKIWVVEYFFTRCGSICPQMNVQMQRIQKSIFPSNEVQLLSFTVDPENDVPDVLDVYAEKHNAKLEYWQFLTGPKESIYKVARKYFFLLKPAETANAGDAGTDFIHTNNFVLIDKKRRIRGYYDGTSVEEVDQLILDIEKLKD
ncbi:MAG: SCO family protein [Bacteroidetes bacterium]|nr:SCO family protein [Bacteroidota bacterium]